MGFALNDDGLFDAQGTVAQLLPDLGLDHRGVGQLFVQAQIDFLAGDLGCEDAGRQIGDLVGGIVPDTLRHQAGNEFPKLRHARSGLGRDHEDLGIDAALEQFLRHGQKLVARHQVDLVEDEDGFLFGLLQALGDAVIILDHAAVAALGTAVLHPGAGAGIDDMHDGVSLAGTGPGRRDHRLVEARLGREDAGRVDEHDLGLVSQGHAAHGKTGRLHLVGDDGDLLADQRVHKGGLAGIGRTDDRGKTAALGSVRHAVLRVSGALPRRPVRLPAWNRPRPQRA